jgi:hypothetical protein
MLRMARASGPCGVQLAIRTAQPAPRVFSSLVQGVRPTFLLAAGHDPSLPYVAIHYAVSLLLQAIVRRHNLHLSRCARVYELVSPGMDPLPAVRARSGAQVRRIRG